jgi:ABC-2 type transport system ATP-binding protein
VGEAPAAPVLEVADLHRAFGAKIAVDRLSFTVGRGEIVGLLGPNGAGKTTTINMILGVLAPSSGTITIDGVDLARARSAALERTNFAAVYANLPGNLTVAQNLRVFGLLYGVRDLGKRIEEVIALCDLAALRDTKFGVLSSGEQTRANLAKALLNQPRLLLLDEPTASLDPAVARDVRAMILGAARDTGAGVLWTSHNMLEVEGVCDRVMILAQGRIRLAGDPRTLAREHGKASLEDLFVEIARGDAAPS